MFTGIVHALGNVVAVRGHEKGKTFSIEAAEFVSLLGPGDSVAINGVCHTVERRKDDCFEVTSVGTTLETTTMGLLESGSRVNLESAATPATALGGHIVQGHVDGVGKVISFEQVGEDRLLTLELPGSVAELTVAKGSIAVDGVSLTVVSVEPGNRVRITIIPFTLAHTTFGEYRAGSRVNVEADIIGKYVRQFVGRINAESNNQGTIA